jgi:hypothetical protein
MLIWDDSALSVPEGEEILPGFSAAMYGCV